MVVSASPAPVIWHDLECGAYRADLPLWRELAAAAGGASARVLDIGAGTGRVAFDLARARHRVTALDRDASLLAALRERTDGLAVETVHADATSFSLGDGDYDLCLVPMQTLQLLRGARQRRALFARAREHMRAGALLACAIVTAVDEFDCGRSGFGPSPERTQIDGTVYLSRAVRVARLGRRLRIERERLIVPQSPGGALPAERDVVELEVLGERGLHQEMRRAGLEPLPSREIPETGEHSASLVVIASA